MQAHSVVFNWLFPIVTKCYIRLNDTQWQYISNNTADDKGYDREGAEGFNKPLVLKHIFTTPSNCAYPSLTYVTSPDCPHCWWSLLTEKDVKVSCVWLVDAL